MRLAVSAGDVAEKSEEFKTTSFAIGDNGVIASILRSKIYSNPIKTIVQELTSNARDAHREVGHSQAICVQLPTSIDSTFSVRDFGLGIDPDRMETIFVKYGASTKRVDNTQTGGFGLGAKSPFSYADTFSVTTWIPDEDNKMIQRRYVAYLDESEMGSLSLVTTDVAESEQQGTLISVPVKVEDIKRFSEALSSACSYWTTKPIVVRGEVKWISSNEKIIFDKPEWVVVETNEWYTEIKALVDEIPYPINQSYMPKSRQLRNFKIYLKFAAGEVPVTANREELDYQDEVIARLAELDKKFVEDLVDSLKESIENDASFVKPYNKILALMQYARDRNISDLGTWLGIDIKKFDSPPHNVNGTLFRSETNRKGFRRTSRSSMLYQSLRSIQAGDLIFINDTGIGTPYALLRYLHDTYKVDVCLFDIPKILTDAAGNPSDEVEYNQLLRQTGVTTLTEVIAEAKANKAPKVPGVKTPRKKRESIVIRQLEKVSSSTSSFPLWKDLKIDTDKLKTLEGCYVTNYRDSTYSVGTLRLIKTEFNMDVYSIPKEHAHRLSPSMKLLNDVYLAKMTEIENDAALFKAVSDHIAVSNDYGLSGISKLMWLLSEYLEDTASPVRVQALEEVEACKETDIAELYRAGLTIFRGTFNPSKDWGKVATLHDELHKIKDEYPILDRVADTMVYEEQTDLLKDLRFYLIEKHNRSVFNVLSESYHNGQVDNNDALGRGAGSGAFDEQAVSESEVVASLAEV